MLTCNQLDLQTLGYQLIIMLQNFPDHSPRSHQKFSSVSAMKLLGIYVEKWMLGHHFLHYCSRGCRRMVTFSIGRCDEPCDGRSLELGADDTGQFWYHLLASSPTRIV